jgi:hypothetical protein
LVTVFLIYLFVNGLMSTAIEAVDISTLAVSELLKLYNVSQPYSHLVYRGEEWGVYSHRLLLVDVWRQCCFSLVLECPAIR